VSAPITKIVKGADALKESVPPSVFALGPFPIEGAPPMDDLVLLLFYPE
jgi:hypothetical protein